MKSIVLFILVAVMLAGCSRSVDVRLARVNTLAEEDYVDSAMQALDSIDRASLSDEFNRRYHDLMTVKTRDKADIPFESDSLALSVMEYFKEHGTDTVRAEACYYAGRVARELGDSPQALDYMQSALDCLDDSHARLKGKISSQMGQIFLNLYLFEQAKPRFKDAIKYNHASSDTLALMYNYSALGETNKWLGNNDSVFNYYEKSLTLSKECNNIKRQIQAMIYIMDYCITIKDFHKADSINTVIATNYDQNFQSGDALKILRINIANYHEDYDKCKFLAEELLDSKSLHSRKYAYMVLAEISRLKGFDKDAYEYIRKYHKCLDSINSSASRDATIHQNSFYNYTLKEKENLKLKAKQKGYIYSITIFFSICIALVFGFMLVIYYNRNLKNKLALQLSRIEQLEANANTLHIVEDLSCNQLKEYIIECFKAITNDVDPVKYTVCEKVLQSETYARLRSICISQCISNVTESEWFSLETIIDLEYKGFMTKLRTLNNKLSEVETRVCLLVKCGFSNNDIGKLLNKSYPTVISIKKRLYEKILLQKGSSTDFEKLILSL